MHYKIKLQEMEFHAFHGCYDLEQKVGNRFIVNMEISTSLADISIDQVEEMVSYLTIYDIVALQMQNTCRTIEAVAHNIIEAVKCEVPQVEGIKCEVVKLAPPLGGKVGRVSVVLKE